MNAIAGQEVNVITSANNDMPYASDVLRFKVREAEDLGWYRFGPTTPIYDEDSGRYVLIQVMTRYKS